MLGKTHLMVGIAATMTVMEPASVSELILSAGVGGLGALISDIDVGTSGSHKDADAITLLAAVVVFGTLACDHVFHTGMADRVIRNSGYGRIVMGLLLFIGICAFGKEQPHRSFMHSFLVGGLLCLAVGMIWEKAVEYFAVGYLSHLATDIFNKKRVRIFYPLNSGVSFGMFHAYGIANQLFFMAASAVVVIELLAFVVRLIW